MHIKSIRREIRLLRYYALGTTLLGGMLLLGAASAVHKAQNATFDTITVNKIVVKDRAGKLAMVLTNHDDLMPEIFAGHAYKSHGGGSRILFYNQLGNEQGALAWSGRVNSDGTYSSGNELTYDTVTTDQLLSVLDGNVNGKTLSYMTGWSRPNEFSPEAQNILNSFLAAKNDSEREAIKAAHPEFFGTFATRYLFGYDITNTAQVMLADAKGHPRIKMFVTPEGQAKLDFLDANGKITAEYPKQ